MPVAQLFEIVIARLETRPREGDEREEARRKKERNPQRGEEFADRYRFPSFPP